MSACRRKVCALASAWRRAIRPLLRGDNLAIATLTGRLPPDTGYTMNQPYPTPIPPSQNAWDIALTRLARAVSGRIAGCAAELERRFTAHGLRSDLQVRQTPRGLSTILALMGTRGLVCIIDLTLIDGMAVGRGPCTSLDIRLLDACGDIAAAGLGASVQGTAFDEPSALELWTADRMSQAATSVYLATLGLFDLPLAVRHAR